MTPRVAAVVAADGHRFEVRCFDAAGVSAAARLLFLPALGVPAAKYDRFAAALAAAGEPVAVPEWRGIGTSTWRAARDRDWGYATLLGQDLRAVLAMLGGGPLRFGGHSLGAQLAAMLAAREPARCDGLVLVAAGVPHPSTFPARYGLPLALLGVAMPAIVGAFGHFPGHALRFAGREAAGVMRDWAATVRTGRYADLGDGEPMDGLLARSRVPVLGIALRDDWMAPDASLRRLLGKLGGPQRVRTLGPAELGVAADHFAWMRRPDGVVACVREGAISP